jgi:tetratricopeptide (TPR) repeat protein
MGLAYSKLSKFEKAIKALKKAIDLNKKKRRGVNFICEFYS